MDFHNFYIPYVFEVEESIFSTFTELQCLGDLENSCRRYSSHEFVFGSFAQPFSLGDLETLGQLPVLQELEGTDNLVLCIIVISSLPTFSRSRNLFQVVSQNYHVRVT
jgi:hypothetical protein